MGQPAREIMEAYSMNGLWTAEFGTSNGMFGGGVVTFDHGKISGGDSWYYYVGEYHFDGGTFRATLRVVPFIEGAQTVFKTVGREITLDLEGSLIDEHHATGQGKAREIPDIKFGVKLTKQI